ncbi:Protein adenylyltransferase SelO, mitochondrial [Pseudocercospora fuligena]|uniref:Selenoprotein O n=1 Tax=Pseudocercospora fuligena TaxID=685502 RepID=A0A8H6VL18_9PEZI|nr:Protein adenylyltransferase SelO, mitochondrial [Pseudocercospora fuligena]
MAIHISNGEQKMFSIRDIPKSNNFTQKLPPDSEFSTPAASHKAERKQVGPRLVKSAAYTFVRPDPFKKSELVGVSKAALKDLAIDPASVETDDFKKTVAGEQIVTIDQDKEPGDNDIYPWAQCYGGYQFGSWAGQLGDGRAISLFETTNPNTGKRYEIQLKGAGKTPYSRFADGKAVVRSSIREFVVSEALNALKIPTTRALSLTLGPEEHVRREMTEPAAMVARFAESWIRLGTFDLPRSRGDRDMVRKLADYVAENVYAGWDSLPAKVPSNEEKDVVEPSRGLSKEEIQGENETAENRYTRLFREIARRNAKTVAAWQAYGFMNGVLNTDNTSIFGLSIDFGPFAFMDNFDPNYTPNHDDHMLRYAYKAQPSIIWWNHVRLAEALGELIGAGPWCDDEEFATKGVRQERADELIKRAETLIDQVGEEYKAVFMAEYKRLMTARLGLKQCKEGDFEELYSELLDTLEALELDFNHAFRRMSNISMVDIDSHEKAKDVAGRFFHHEGLSGLAGSEDDARERLAKWLGKWRTRILEDWPSSEEARKERIAAMKAVNPNFVPRSWVLDELIERVEKKGEREILGHIMDMALQPFNDNWGWNKEEEDRFCGDVPKYQRAMQCSCSS